MNGAEDKASLSEPLCVDLDGTLVKSDTLLDSVIVLARQSPCSAAALPYVDAQGKAAFKRNVSSVVALDVAHLPYNHPLLEFLRQQHAAGREIFLATGADSQLAERVAAHLGIFTGVLASDGSVNLTGGNKLAAFQQRFPAGFSYIGNSRRRPASADALHPSHGRQSQPCSPRRIAFGGSAANPHLQ